MLPTPLTLAGVDKLVTVVEKAGTQFWTPPWSQMGAVYAAPPRMSLSLYLPTLSRPAHLGQREHKRVVIGDRWLGDLGVSSQSMAPGLSDGDSVGNGSSWPGVHDGHMRGPDSDPQALCLHLLRPRDAALPGPRPCP